LARLSPMNSTENIEISLRASATVISPLLSLLRMSVRFIQMKLSTKYEFAIYAVVSICTAC
jgi:hypothetical protein